MVLVGVRVDNSKVISIVYCWSTIACYSQQSTYSIWRYDGDLHRIRHFLDSPSHHDDARPEFHSKYVDQSKSLAWGSMKMRSRQPQTTRECYSYSHNEKPCHLTALCSLSILVLHRHSSFDSPNTCCMPRGGPASIRDFLSSTWLIHIIIITR